MTDNVIAYTFLSAKYTEADHSVILVQTTDRGVVAITQDQPELWALFEASGIIPDAYVEPMTPGPQFVTMAQCQAQLRRAGVFDQVDAAFRAEGGGALMAWLRAQQVYRTSALVAEIASLLGWDDDTVDQQFRSAAAIVIGLKSV